MGSRRVAQALWIAWAIVVWNVVFDHVIVMAGREYVIAALAAARGAGPSARMDDWMRPAVVGGLWIATASSALILLAGFAAIQRVTTPTQGPPKGGPHGKTVQNGKTVQREGVA